MNIKYKVFLRFLPFFLPFFSVNSTIGQNFKENLNNWRPEINTVALLPFKLWVGRSGDKLDTTVAMENEAKVRKAYAVQKEFYQWIIANHKKCGVTFQDIEVTDSLLHKTKLPLNELFSLNEGALCQYLNADAVAYCEIRMSNPGYNWGDEIGNGLTEAAIYHSSGLWLSGRNHNNRTTYKLSIYDTSGEIIWRRYENQQDYANNDNVYLDKSFEGFIKLALPFNKH